MPGTTKGQIQKDTRKAIEQQFETVLTQWKEQLGEKKFKNRVRKAAKLFSKGLPVLKKDAPASKKATSKTVRGKKATAKKTAAKPAAEQ
ncbi:hypothetical protein F0L74_27745 [Chitinophaga agrisoli]|uniref:Uncharacterized protein n=1 Tax=Chitinophaga agrisoli TaxID=2607653 RepID=A0A5B2VP52_9BACT|nr:hypothetical protein [Chitinophaga agrisoli]KAA2239977.1 hypothetical protein F0L74_27745 [Chitinophaga agrisoli]